MLDRQGFDQSLTSKPLKAHQMHIIKLTHTSSWCNKQEIDQLWLKEKKIPPETCFKQGLWD